MYLFIYLSIYLSIYRGIYLSIHLSIYLSGYFIHLQDLRKLTNAAVPENVGGIEFCSDLPN